MSKFNVEKINNYIQDVLEDEKINMNWQVEFYADMMRIIGAEKKITVVTRDAYERYYGMKQAKLSTNW